MTPVVGPAQFGPFERGQFVWSEDDSCAYLVGQPGAIPADGVGVNHLRYNTDFGAWPRSEVTVTDGVAVPSPTLGLHSLYLDGVSPIDPAAPVTASIRVQARGYGSLMLRVGNAGETVAFQAIADLGDNPRIVSSNAYGAGAAVRSAALYDEDDGYYRVSLSGDVASLSSYRIRIFVRRDALTHTFAGDGARGLYLSGPIGALADARSSRMGSDYFRLDGSGNIYIDRPAQPVSVGGNYFEGAVSGYAYAGATYLPTATSAARVTSIAAL